MAEQRRESDYKERLSSRMLLIACITALFVLLDPKVLIPLGADGQVLSLGGAGFSLDIKGMVIGAIIIEGLKSIKEYWLGTSAGGQKQAESMSRMAEAAPAVAAAVVAAADKAPLKTDDVKIDATGGDVTINQETKP